MNNPCIHNYNDVKHLLNADSVIFDIGLNIGNFSDLICKNNKYKQLFGFEPVSKYFNEAKHRLNNYKNIKIYNIGLSNTNEILPIYIAGDHHKGWNTFLEKDPNQKEHFYEKMKKEFANVITLDKFCEENKIDKIDFVKIDVEGFECRVIEGFLNTLERIEKKPYIYIEVGWGTNHPEWLYCKNIYNKLFEIGYQPIEFSNETKDILFCPLSN